MRWGSSRRVNLRHVSGGAMGGIILSSVLNVSRGTSAFSTDRSR